MKKQLRFTVFGILIALGSIVSGLAYAQQNTAAPKMCVYSINEYGHSPICQCPSGYDYDGRSGKCNSNGKSPETTAVQGNIAGPVNCFYGINEYGHSPVCQCPSGYDYDGRSGKCSSNGKSPRAAAAQEKGKAQGNIASPEMCVRAINEYGHSPICQCPVGYRYTERKGQCIK